MIEFWKDKSGYTIRKGTHRNFCVVDNLDKKDLAIIHRKIGKILKIPDFKAEYK